MAETKIGIRIANDRNSVQLEILPAGQPATRLELDLDQLSNLIDLLGETRAHMVEGLAMQPLEGKSVRTVTNPNWYIQVARSDGSLLAFDHPAFGPVGFALPTLEVAEIVRLLNSHLSFLPSAGRARN